MSPRSAWSVELRTIRPMKGEAMKSLFAVMGSLLSLAILTQSGLAQRSAPAPVTQALEQEMKRAFDVLKQKGNPAPYFISYSVTETDSVDIEASLGALHSRQKDR